MTTNAGQRMSTDTYTVHVYIAMHTGYAYEEQERFCFSASCNYKKPFLFIVQTQCTDIY